MQRVRGPGLHGSEAVTVRARVEQRLDGSLAVKFRQNGLQVTECQPRPKTAPPPQPVRAQKPRTKTAYISIKDFNLQKSLPWRLILGPERANAGGEPG